MRQRTRSSRRFTSGRAAAGLALALAVTALLPASRAAAQQTIELELNTVLSSTIVIPQSRAIAPRRVVPGRPAVIARVELTSVRAGVVIRERAATTTMDIELKNTGSRRAEARLLVPVPDGAAVRGFSYHGAAPEPTARLLPRAEAESIYHAIVAQTRDPALLEFAGYNLIRSSVFPIQAGATQRVRLTYEHLLEVDGNRVDYVLPRSESLDYAVPWKVSVKIGAARPISTVFSPSHALETIRNDPKSVSARIRADATTEPGAFRLSYLTEGDGVSASLFAYPDARTGGGYFLLLAGLPAQTDREQTAIRREVTLVLDRSGSMSGEKLAQVKTAALQLIGGLEKGETFNVIVYNEAVEPFSTAPIEKTEESVAKLKAFLDGLQARGGTNIHDALLESLRQKPTEGSLPLVLFLTDGLPTVGPRSEIVIRDLVKKHNPYGRRVFTFGVGLDVNTPLLERIASVSRGMATYVLPEENVELKVAKLFRGLSGPILASPSLRAIGADGKIATLRISDIVPHELPDLFDGDQLTVLGRYRGEEDLSFVLAGNYMGKERTFQFRFGLDTASTRNGFVSRLWASRKIAFLEDAIRDLGDQASGHGASIPAASAVSSSIGGVGAGPGAGPGAGAAVVASDPRLKELVDEIVRLSTEFGILSEYTAFLAREGTDLSNKDDVLSTASSNFYRRAVRTRTGSAGLNQDVNRQRQKGQSALNLKNTYYDENLQRVSLSNVRQVADKAFYKRGDRWVDSAVVENEKTVTPSRTITFGSDEFMELVKRLAASGRQGYVSMQGDILLHVDGETVLVRGPKE